MKILIPIRLDPESLEHMARDPKYAQEQLFLGLEQGIYKKQEKLSDDLQTLENIGENVRAGIARVKGY